MMRFGMPRTPNCAGVRGLSSTFIFTTLRRLLYSPASCSTTGPIVRHGPHHGAQKSIRTGVLACSTSLWNWSSLMLCTSDMRNASLCVVRVSITTPAPHATRARARSYAFLLLLIRVLALLLLLFLLLAQALALFLVALGGRRL